MTADIKLLPCPFCGRDEHLQVEHLEGTVVHPAYRVSCDNCGASTGYADKDCRAVWNERANMEPLIAENERLRAEAARLRRSLHEAIIHGNRQTGRAERLAEEIDWIKSQPEGARMFAEIEAAAKASFHRHRTSCRGQVLTRADNYESHLVWATLEWAKRTNAAEQHAERLEETLRPTKEKLELIASVLGEAIAAHDEMLDEVGYSPFNRRRVDEAALAVVELHATEVWS